MRKYDQSDIHRLQSEYETVEQYGVQILVKKAREKNGKVIWIHR